MRDCDAKLAIEGGSPVRKNPMPPRNLIAREERDLVSEVFDEALRTGHAFRYNGDYEQRFETAFSEFMGGGFADGVSSGTSAILSALGALQLDALSEVIVPAITDTGGVMPALFLGCVPVMADTSSQTYNIDAESISRVITERTRAIVVAHIAGEPVDMDPIMEIAAKHGLVVIEDCAQAPGAEYKGRKVGTLGHIAAFSTMSGKHFCTGGQGGIVYTRDERLHWQAKRFADRGKPFAIEEFSDSPVSAGLNCNLTDLAAAVGIAQLRKLPGILESCRRVARGVFKGVSESCQVVSPGWIVPHSNPVFWFLRLKVDVSKLVCDKQTFVAALAKENILVDADYSKLPFEGKWFTEQKVFGSSGFPWQCSDYKGDRRPKYSFKNCKKVIADHFNVFIRENYGEEEIEDICTAILKVEKALIKR